MAQTYIEYNFVVTPLIPGAEILMAELGEIGFDSFEETATGLLAYILKQHDHPNLLNQVQLIQSPDFNISHTTRTVEQQDWNAVWEREFQPIEVDNTCRIRASHHPKKEVPYDILINPKMAFGSGHHATTYLMLSRILPLNLSSKKVLDMGCGTGVLSILASLKGAAHIDAIDIDPWSFQNTQENIALNHCDNITPYEGDASLLKGKHYAVIFANITRNILLNDIEHYAACLDEQGVLLMSGFYVADLPLIQQECAKFGLIYSNHESREDWVGVTFVKSQE